MTTLSQLPKEPGLYIPGHATPGTEQQYRIFKLDRHGYWSEIGRHNQGHEETVYQVYDSWLPLARLTIPGTITATSETENPLLKHIRSFLRGTVGGNNLAGTIKTGDEAAAVDALNAASDRINGISQKRNEAETKVRQLEDDRAAFRRHIGLDTEK